MDLAEAHRRVSAFGLTTFGHNPDHAPYEARLVIAYLASGSPEAVAAVAMFGDEIEGATIVARLTPVLMATTAHPEDAELALRGPLQPTFQTVGAMGNVLTEVALELLARGPFGWDVAGTATVIGPHLAITAKHVVADYLRQAQTHADATEVNFTLEAMMFLADGVTGFGIEVKRLVLIDHTDIAVLHLGGLPDPPPFQAWPLVSLDLNIPRMGSRVMAAGYHAASYKVDESRRVIEVTRDFALAGGTVTDIFLERRGGHQNFPCFETNARFDGGMSGGPVLNEHGAICGIVCCNLPPSQAGDRHVSCVTLLWPMISTVIDFGRAGSANRESIHQLMLDGVVPTENAKDFSVTIDEEADRWTIERLQGGLDGAR